MAKSPKTDPIAEIEVPAEIETTADQPAPQAAADADQPEEERELTHDEKIAVAEREWLDMKAIAERAAAEAERARERYSDLASARETNGTLHEAVQSYFAREDEARAARAAPIDASLRGRSRPPQRRFA